MRNTTNYLSLKNIQGNSNRKIINYAPLKENQDWLLDIIYDSFAVERKTQLVPNGVGGVPLPVLLNSDGPATKIRRSLEQFFKKLFAIDGQISWSVGARGRRAIGISSDNQTVIKNIFSLSTGQTSLLNIFLTMMRDADISSQDGSKLEDISGIVIVDEIDVHLHTDFQHNILPELISLFPKVQFILTTHSPLFILGLEKSLGPSGYDIVGLPSGNLIDAERFVEFGAAYSHFRETSTFNSDIQKAISESHQPTLFVEGSIDVDYLAKAAEILNKPLGQTRVLDANGYGGLDKIWKHFDSHVAEALSQKVVLLYDCDVIRQNSDKGQLSRRVMASRPRKISSGIENMFPDALIEQAIAEHPQFVDVVEAHQKTTRGNTIVVPETWTVNKDEKRNLANWILENAIATDFAEFDGVLDMIRGL